MTSVKKGDGLGRLKQAAEREKGQSIKGGKDEHEFPKIRGKHFVFEEILSNQVWNFYYC